VKTAMNICVLCKLGNLFLRLIIIVLVLVDLFSLTMAMFLKFKAETRKRIEDYGCMLLCEDVRMQDSGAWFCITEQE
jgi:hypothetical protein